MTDQTTNERLWTPANKVTFLRICLIPVFVAVIVSPWPDWVPIWPDADIWKPWIAAAVFALIAATDALDGYLARSRNEVTNLGKFMDPIADKILVAAALVALTELSVLPTWVTLIILTREFIVSGIRMVAATQNMVIAASMWGKSKTVTQIAAILLFIVKDSALVSDFSTTASQLLYAVSWLVMVAALVLTIISMFDYFVKAKVILGFTTSSRDVDVAASLADTDESSACATVSDEVLYSLAEQVVGHATTCGVTVGTAESCTGGMIGAALTAVPGSSEAVNGGVISYANQVKMSALGVHPHTLETFGAVSEETACEMARGARGALGVDYAVSVTGIAGPGGAVEGKPVGTVWIGLCDADITLARNYHFEGTREQVRRQTVQAALQTLLDAIRVDEEPSDA